MTQHDHVGQRYLDWENYTKSSLSPAEQARDLDRFAAEFDALPPSLEPSAGWAATMATLCRRGAKQLRGEPVEEWLPQSVRTQPGCD